MFANTLRQAAAGSTNERHWCCCGNDIENVTWSTKTYPGDNCNSSEITL